MRKFSMPGAILDAILGALLSCLVMCPAEAAPKHDAATAGCINGAGAAQVTSCTRAIASGKHKGTSLANLYHFRAVAHMGLADLGKSLDDFNQALRIDPKTGNLLLNRGGLHVDSGDFDRAISDYNEALRANPRSAAVLVHRGIALVYKGELDRALEDLNDALRLDPKQNGAHAGRATLFRLKGDFDRAIAEASEAIRLTPKTANYYLIRGTALKEKGELERAGSDFRDALRLTEESLRANPKNPVFLGIKARILFHLGRQDDARAANDELLRLIPRNPIGLETRGRLREAQSDFSGAKSDYDTLLAIAPSHIEGRNGLARVAAKLAGTSAPVTSGAVQPTPASASVAAALVPAPLATTPASPGKRVALVIGNSAYSGVAALPNPKRDADTIAKALRATGFTKVTLASDLTRDALIRALRSFEDDVEGADWAMIYFAGHGVEIAGVNYLVPVDAMLRSDRDVSDETVPLERVLTSIEGAKRLRVVVLDACRDNPFVPQMRRTVATRSIGRGLARVEPDGGTLIAYSAKHGQIALDGDGQTSPFVSALVKHIQTPNLEITRVFRLVRDDVLAATGKRQEPFIYGTLPGEEFFFVQK